MGPEHPCGSSWMTWQLEKASFPSRLSGSEASPAVIDVPELPLLGEASGNIFRATPHMGNEGGRWQ